AQTVVLPPGSLVLAPMPAEQVGEEPHGLLLRVSLLGLRRYPGQEPVRQRAASSLALVDLHLGIAEAVLGARNLLAVLGRFGPERFEPVAERARGEAVLAVVRLDDAPVLVLRVDGQAQLQAALNHPQRGAGLVEGLRALEAVERFELLQGVLLHARAQRLL